MSDDSRYGGQDRTWEYMLIAALVGLILWFIFGRNPHLLVAPWRWIRIAESAVFQWISLTPTGRGDVKEIFGFLISNSAREISGSVVTIVNQRMWEITRWPYAALLLWLAYRHAMRCVIPKGEMTMEGLLQAQSRWRSSLLLFLKERPDQEPLDTGRWAARMKPIDFAKQHGLIDESGQFNTAKARAVYIDQLGPPVRDLASLSEPAAIIAAMCVARIQDDRGIEQRLIDRSNRGKAGHKGDWVAAVRLARKTLQRHADCETLKSAIEGHGYVSTLLMRLIWDARDYGILPIHWLPWLKITDRTLWYVLLDLGVRDSAEAAGSEGAGPTAHFRAEFGLRQRFRQPRVDGAVTGLVATLVSQGHLDPTVVQQDDGPWHN